MAKRGLEVCGRKGEEEVVAVLVVVEEEEEEVEQLWAW